MATGFYRYPIRFGGIELPVIGFQTTHNRRLIRWDPARGDGAALSDRGRDARVDNWTVAIVDGDDQLARRDAVLALLSSGEPRILSHPLDGSWYARLESVAESVAPGQLQLALTFVEDLPATLGRFESPIVQERTSAEAVIARETAVRDTAATLGDTTLAADMNAVGARASILATEWQTEIIENGNVWTPDQAAALQSFRTEIKAVHDALGKRQDSYYAMTAIIDIWGELETLARSVRRTTVTVFPVDVLTTTTLSPLLVAFYGADANRYRADVIARNAIRDPLRIRAGTTLEFPRP